MNLEVESGAFQESEIALLLMDVLDTEITGVLGAAVSMVSVSETVAFEVLVKESTA